jgi:hypothetical protein
MSEKPLGAESLPSGTFEHDLGLLDRYQAFSAEILRLAMLGVTAIGAIFLSVYGADVPRTKLLHLLVDADNQILLALGGFGISAVAALAHRYFSTDSLAYHLKLLRLAERGGAVDQVYEEKKGRRNQFGASRWVLGAAAIAFACGVIGFSWMCGKIVQSARVAPNESLQLTEPRNAPQVP